MATPNVVLLTLALAIPSLAAAQGIRPQLRTEEKGCEAFTQRVYPRDCYEAVVKGGGKAGMYKIAINLNRTQPFRVECRYDDTGNIWTVFQKRVGSRTSFDRSWNDYRYGFGDVPESYWMGLDRLYEMTTHALHELYVEVETLNGSVYHARYDQFAVGNANEQYEIKFLGQQTGTAGDSLRAHVGYPFSTRDRLYDKNFHFDDACPNVAIKGWWAHQCFYSNLNADMGSQGKCGSNPISWTTVNGPRGCVARTTMMIRSSEIPYIEPIVIETTTVNLIDNAWDLI